MKTFYLCLFCVLMALSLKGQVTNAPTDLESVFKTKCPKCGADVINKPLDVVTNGKPVHSSVGGTTTISRTAQMQCLNCKTVFYSKADLWLKDPVAEEIKIPRKTAMNLTILGVQKPILLLKTNSICVIEVPRTRGVTLTPMADFTIEQLIAVYSTNKESITIFELTPRR